MDKIPTRVTIRMKSRLLISLYFPVVLFIMLYKEALSFGSQEEILQCDLSNECY